MIHNLIKALRQSSVHGCVIPGVIKIVGEIKLRDPDDAWLNFPEASFNKELQNEFPFNLFNIHHAKSYQEEEVSYTASLLHATYF